MGKTAFDVHFAAMVVLLKEVTKELDAGNRRKTLILVRDALAAGRAAWGARSQTPVGDREDLVRIMLTAHKLYQQELAAKIPEEERDFLASVLGWWKDLRVGAIEVDPIDQLILMFEIAKNRLSKGKEVLGVIYKTSQAPAPLQDIMRPFLDGEVTQEKTAERLEKQVAKMRKWVSFLGGTLPA